MCVRRRIRAERGSRTTTKGEEEPRVKCSTKESLQKRLGPTQSHVYPGLGPPEKETSVERSSLIQKRPNKDVCTCRSITGIGVLDPGPSLKG